MYDIKNAAFNKAETYFNTVMLLDEKGVYDESTLILAQIATECYLSSILENLRDMSCIQIFGAGKVPHDTTRLYNKIYPLNKPHNPALPPINLALKRQLEETYEDYNAKRYAYDSTSRRGMRNVTELDIMQSVRLVKEVQLITEAFREQFFEEQMDYLKT